MNQKHKSDLPIKTLRYTLILFFALALSACGKKEAKIHPVYEPVTESVYASGIVKCRDQYQAFSTVSGLIREIRVKEGDIVRKGDPLIILDNETSRLNARNAELLSELNDYSRNREKLNELKQSIDQGFSRYLNDSLQFQRQKNLWSEGIGSRSELEQRELALTISRSAYRAAWLRYKDLEKQLAFSTKQSKNNLEISLQQQNDFIIRSKVNGKVFSLLKEAGELVTPQMPVAVLGNPEAWFLELEVDELDITQIRNGQTVFVTLDSYRDQVFTATVTRIYEIMDVQRRTFKVEAEWVKKPTVLFPNLNVEANILLRKKDKALTIPRNCLISDSFVMTEKRGKVRVITGLRDVTKVEILSGLTPEDDILDPTK